MRLVSLSLLKPPKRPFSKSEATMGRPKGEPTQTLSLRVKVSTYNQAAERYGRRINALMAEYLQHLANGGVQIGRPQGHATPEEVYMFWKTTNFCTLAEVAAYFNISPGEAKELIRQQMEQDRRESGTTYPTI